MKKDTGTARYRAMIDACDLVETLKLLKALYLKTHAIGKSQKLQEVDIQYRDIAEKVICDEFAYVLGVTPKEIKEKLLAAIHRKKAAKGKRDPVHLRAQPDEEADN